MEVAVVSFENPATFMGGVEVHSVELVRALNDLGIQATMVTRAPDTSPPPRDSWDIPVTWVKVPVPRKGLPAYHHQRVSRPFFHARLPKHIGKVDLVHSQDDAGMGMLGQAPVVATVHTDVWGEFQAAQLPFPRSIPQRLAVAWDLRRWRRYAEELAATIAVSQATAQNMQEHLGMDPTVIPNGLAPVDPIPQDRARARVHPGFEQVVLFLSRLAPVKRPDRVVEAMVYLPDEVGLLLGGKGEMRAALEEQIHALGLQDRVRLLGFIPEQDKMATLAAADVFVLPSEHEGQPISLLEALGQATPVVVSDLGWLPEALRGYAEEAPVDRGPEALAAAIGTQLRRGRVPQAPVPSWAEVAQRTLEVYEQALARR